MNRHGRECFDVADGFDLKRHILLGDLRGLYGDDFTATPGGFWRGLVTQKPPKQKQEQHQHQHADYLDYPRAGLVGFWLVRRSDLI